MPWHLIESYQINLISYSLQNNGSCWNFHFFSVKCVFPPQLLDSPYDCNSWLQISCQNYQLIIDTTFLPGKYWFTHHLISSGSRAQNWKLQKLDPPDLGLILALLHESLNILLNFPILPFLHLWSKVDYNTMVCFGDYE